MALGGSSAGGGQASPGAIKAGEAYVELSANDKKARDAFDRMIARLRKVGQTIKTVGLGIMAGGASVLGPLAAATKVFAGFDDKMRMVAAVTKAVGQDFKDLNNLALELGRTTSFTAVQVADLMIELAKAGLSKADIESATASILNLSRATGTELSLAASIAADTMNQFGLSAKDMTRIADVLSTAANASTIDVESLADSFKYAAPDLANLNMSLEESATLVAVLGKLGIKGTSAGTALRRMAVIMSSESEKIKKSFNVDTKDAAGNLRKIPDILREIFEATKDMGTADRAEALSKIFGLLTITSTSALAKNTNIIAEIQEKINAASGNAADIAKKMDEGIGGSIRILTSALEGLTIALGSAASPAMKEFANVLTNNLGPLTQWVNDNREIIGTLALVAVGVTAAGAVIATFGFGIIGITAAVAALKAVLVGLYAVALAPITLKFIALSAIIGGVSYLLTELAGTSGLIGPMFASIGDTFRVAWGGIVDAIKAGDLSKALSIAWAAIKVIWHEGVLLLVKTWAGLKQQMPVVLLGTVQILKDIWDEFIKWMIKRLADAIVNTVKVMSVSLPGGDLLVKSAELTRDTINTLVLATDNTLTEALDRLAKKVNNGGDAWVDAQEEVLRKMKEQLAELLRPPAGPNPLEVAPMPREVNRNEKVITRLNNNLDKLATSVRGTFGSSNYAGAFRYGGKTELEKQTGLLKNIDGKLGNIEDKLPGVFD